MAEAKTVLTELVISRGSGGGGGAGRGLGWADKNLAPPPRHFIASTTLVENASFVGDSVCWDAAAVFLQTAGSEVDEHSADAPRQKRTEKVSPARAAATQLQLLAVAAALVDR